MAYTNAQILATASSSATATCVGIANTHLCTSAAQRSGKTYHCHPGSPGVIALDAGGTFHAHLLVLESGALAAPHKDVLAPVVNDDDAVGLQLRRAECDAAHTKRALDAQAPL
jgi:hypothetical protein